MTDGKGHGAATVRELAEPRGFWSFIGRVIDYSFGRNGLIGLASLMLLAISGFATWSGMSDFIVGVATSPANKGREIVGGLSVSNELLIIAIVVALTFLMWLALRETFATGRRWTDRAVTLPLYLFLALWSIGFGYGFWWSLIAGEEATRSGLSGLQEDARDAGVVVAARLEGVRIQLDSVVRWSDGQMAREETSGGSCGTSSAAGRGPLYNARRSVSDQVSSLRDSISTSWLEPVKADLSKLRSAVSGLEGTTIAERQKSFDAMAQTIRGSARLIAARSNQLGRSTGGEMRALATAVAIKPNLPGFSCYDPTLAQRLLQAAEQAEAPALLRLRSATFSEGPAGVANAIKNLWSNISGYSGSIIRFVFNGGSSQTATAVEVAPHTATISGRDLIALLATLGIDLGLFVLTLLNPPRTPPQWRLPAPLVRQITDAIRTAVSRAPDANLEWIRRHFLHHKGASYFIIPNVYSCDLGRPGEQERSLAMNQLAGVLDDLDVVDALNARQLRALGQDEMRDSLTDLTSYREQWHAEHKIDAASQSPGRKSDDNVEGNASPNPIAQRRRIRNHGLFSKAERALEIAGWSEIAKSDVEVFKLTDNDGLTPLLAILNEPDGTANSAVDSVDMQHLPVNDTQQRYLEALVSAINIEANVAEEIAPVIENIRASQKSIDPAMEMFFIKWTGLAEHALRERLATAKLVLRNSQSIIIDWAKDRNTEYPISEIPTADLQLAVVTYRLLQTIQADLSRSIPEHGSVAGHETSTSDIRHAIKAVGEFLEPTTKPGVAIGAKTRAMVAALNNLAQLKVLPPSPVLSQ